MRWQFLLLILFLGGCVSIPKDQKTAHPFGPTPIHLPQETDTAFTEGGWPDTQWWNMFDDQQLSNLIVLAIAESPSIKKAQSRVQLAHQLAKKQKSALFPRLDGNAQVNWQHLAKDGLYRAFAPVFPAWITQIDLGLNFTYEFDFWGKYRKLFHAALGQERAQRAEAAQATLMITTSVARGYFELQADLEKETVLRDTLQSRMERLKLASDRRRAGIDNEQVPLVSDQDMLAAKQALSQTHKLIAIDKHSINTLIGRAPQTPIDSPKSSFDGAFPLPQRLSIDLLARRPDLMAQIWRVEAAAKEVGAAKTDFYPNIDLSMLFGYESLFWDNVFDWKNRMDSLLPALHLPIFTAGKIRANMLAKQASYQEATHSYNELVLNAAKEVVDQITTLQSATEQLTWQQKILSEAQENYALEKDRFTVGISNYNSVLIAEEAWLDQKLTLIDLRLARLLAVLNLVRALGGGYLDG